jgi:uncharacterized membrane protein
MAEKSGSLGETLLKGEAAERLGREAGKYLRAQGRRLLVHGLGHGLGHRLGDLTKKLTPSGDHPDSGDGGRFLGDVAKRVGEGKSVGKAAGAAIPAMLRKVGAKVKRFLFGRSKGPKLTNIVEDLNIGVPVSVAYNQWTQYKEFPSYMKGVQSVDHKDPAEGEEAKSNWVVNVFRSRRSWEATTTEQIPDRRIAWTSTGGKGITKGVITFHPLADDLTKLLLVMEYYPHGVVEKIGNIWRAGGRRARLDVKHFRRFISMRGEETGAWRGEIRDGVVVRAPEEEEGREEVRVPEQARKEQPPREAEKRPAEQPQRQEAERQSAKQSQRQEAEREPAQQPQEQQARAGRRS